MRKAGDTGAEESMRWEVGWLRRKETAEKEEEAEAEVK